MNFRFTLANLGHVNLITEIKTQAYRDEKKRFRPSEDLVPKWFDNEWYTDLDECKRLIKEFDVYLVYLDDSVIGTFWINTLSNGTLALEDFCILPKYQGNGYGYALLEKIEQLYPHNKVWELGTPFYSVRNQHLYEKFGYKKIGTAAEETVFLYQKNIL